MSNENDLQIKPVYVDGPTPRPVVVPVAPWYERLWNWVWNFARRPRVRFAQKELKRIAFQVKADLTVEVLPQLWQLRLVCPQCRDNYGFLRNEVFVSTIRMILQRMQCETHAEIYNEFLASHESTFNQSEDLAAWINGFKS